MDHRKQVLHLAKAVAAMFFALHPYIVAPIGATDVYHMQWYFLNPHRNRVCRSNIYGGLMKIL